MLTSSFWRAALERALKTFAQALAALLSAGGFGLLQVDWANALSMAALAAVVSVLTSVASTQVGGPGPSLGAEIPVESAGLGRPVASQPAP